jgi:hypothetical protein
MNTNTNPRTELTVRNADQACGPRDCGAEVKRSWTWQLGEESFARLVHVRPIYRTQGRPTWGASVVAYAPGAGEFDQPMVELYSPLVSTQARAFEWLNAAVREAGL